MKLSISPETSVSSDNQHDHIERNSVVEMKMKLVRTLVARHGGWLGGRIT